MPAPQVRTLTNPAEPSSDAGDRTAARGPFLAAGRDLPEHVEDTVWGVLDAAAGDPWGFRQRYADDPEGEDVRYAAVGQLALTYWVNRPLRRLTVLNIVWLG